MTRKMLNAGHLPFTPTHKTSGAIWSLVSWSATLWHRIKPPTFWSLEQPFQCLDPRCSGPRNKVAYHNYADDTQICISLWSSSLCHCLEKFDWMEQNFLKLNRHKYGAHKGTLTETNKQKILSGGRNKVLCSSECIVCAQESAHLISGKIFIMVFPCDSFLIRISLTLKLCKNSPTFHTLQQWYSLLSWIEKLNPSKIYENALFFLGVLPTGL